MRGFGLWGNEECKWVKKNCLIPCLEYFLEAGPWGKEEGLGIFSS